MGAVLEFKDTIMKYGLSDLDYKGVPFTWTNLRFKGGQVKDQLDRFLSLWQWRNRFPNILVIHMTIEGSDHLPIWIGFNKGRTSKTVRIGRAADFILRIIGPCVMIAKD